MPLTSKRRVGKVIGQCHSGANGPESSLEASIQSPHVDFKPEGTSQQYLKEGQRSTNGVDHRQHLGLRIGKRASNLPVTPEGRLPELNLIEA